MATTKDMKVVQNFAKQLSVYLIIGMSLAPSGVQAATLGYADVVLDYFDSGAGPVPGPYGGEIPGGIGFPVPVSPNVVLGDDPGPIFDFLSLPTGTSVTVGFTDETIIESPGNEIFIREYGQNGEQANVFVSSNLTDFVFLGTAQDDLNTAFDLATIGYTEPVQAIRIVGLNNGGDSPGFDVVSVQVLPGSIGAEPEPVPEPSATVGLLALGAFGALSRLLRKHR